MVTKTWALVIRFCNNEEISKQDHDVELQVYSVELLITIREVSSQSEAHTHIRVGGVSPRTSAKDKRKFHRILRGTGSGVEPVAYNSSGLTLDYCINLKLGDSHTSNSFTRSSMSERQFSCPSSYFKRLFVHSF